MFTNRFLWTFFLFGLIAVVVSVKAQENQSDEDPEDRGIFSKFSLSTAVKLIGGKFAGAAAGCVEEAAKSCKSELKHLKKFFKCAGDFFKDNKGKCLIE